MSRDQREPERPTLCHLVWIHFAVTPGEKTITYFNGGVFVVSTKALFDAHTNGRKVDTIKRHIRFRDIEDIFVSGQKIACSQIASIRLLALQQCAGENVVPIAVLGGHLDGDVLFFGHGDSHNLLPRISLSYFAVVPVRHNRFTAICRFFLALYLQRYSASWVSISSQVSRPAALILG